MVIKTTSKADIGDIVYTVECYNGEFTPSEPLIVDTIYTKTTSEGTVCTYKVYYTGEYMRICEDLCFTDHTECTEWCDKHN